MSKGIWVSPDQFVQFAEKKAFSDHIVTRDRSPDFAALGSYLPNPDPILRARGKTVEVYRELRGDAAVGAGVRRRKAAVTALEWGLERGNASARVERNIKALLDDLDINQLINDVLEAPLYGYQPIEILWGKGQGWTVPVELVAKPPEWFVFSTDNELRFKSRAALLEGERLPRRKFLLPRNGATYQNPWGVADLAMVFWPATFKKGGMRFWMQFAEKYGTPWLVGKVPRNTDRKVKDELAEDLESMIQDAIAVVPDDSSVEIVEAAAKAGAAEAFEKLLMWCRSEINIALLGQNQTTEASSTNASAKAGLEVADDLRDSDARLVESTVNQLTEWIMYANGISGPAPKCELWQAQEGDASQADRDQKLTTAGVKFSRKYWMRSYNLNEDDLEEVANASSATHFNNQQEERPADAATDEIESDAVDEGQDFAEADVSGRAPDQHLAMLRPQLSGQSDQWFAQIESLVNQVGSLEELRDQLLTLYPALGIDDYANALGVALQASHLAGRNDIEEDL
jgi:phage gp29-like protein